MIKHNCTGNVERIEDLAYWNAVTHVYSSFHYNIDCVG